MRKLRRSVARYWLKLLTRLSRFEAGQIGYSSEYTIGDGAIYTLPAILPRYIQQQGAQVVKAWMEATQKQTMAFQFDAPFRSQAYDGPITMPTEDPLEEWSYATRVMVLTNCHAAYQRNPIAKRAVQLTQQFAVGKGFTLTCRNSEVRKVLDAFIDDLENAVSEYQKTALQDLFVDGELFIRRFKSDDGRVVIVPIPPWHITEIETDPGFFRRVIAYHLDYSVTVATKDGPKTEPIDEWIPAADIRHVAINRHSYELRGRSDLFVILPWLRAFKDWLESRARQNRLRNALIWDVTIAGAAPGSVANAAARYRTPPPDGSVVVHSEKETWDAKSNSLNASDAEADGRQIKIMNAIGVGLPEYMLSDGQNANLASATAQELPALWKFIDAQQIMIEQVWNPILNWVIEAALEAGLLPAEVELQDANGDPILSKPERPRARPELPGTDETDGLPEQPEPEGNKQYIPVYESFDVQYADLQASDPKTLMEALTIATQGGWISDEGARSKAAPLMGLDADIEDKRLQQEAEENRDKAGQGLIMPVPPPQMPGQQAQGVMDAESA